MGGRGAASGMSVRGIKYGQEYHSILTVDNIKFIMKNQGSTTAPLETMSAFQNRVYVTVNARNIIKAITLYDSNGLRKAEIHLDHTHNGLKPHVHIGYDEPHNNTNTIALGQYTRLVNKILKVWSEFNGKR